MNYMKRQDFTLMNFYSERYNCSGPLLKTAWLIRRHFSLKIPSKYCNFCRYINQKPTATNKMLTCAWSQTQIRTVLCENIYNKRLVNSCPIFLVTVSSFSLCASLWRAGQYIILQGYTICFFVLGHLHIIVFFSKQNPPHTKIFKNKCNKHCEPENLILTYTHRPTWDLGSRWYTSDLRVITNGI